MAQEFFSEYFDDKQVIEGLDKINETLKKIQDTSAKTGEQIDAAFSQGYAASQDLNKSLEKSVTQTMRHAQATQAAQREQSNFLAATKQTISGIQLGGKSLGEWADNARDFAQKINLGGKATQGASAAFRIFSTVLKATGIGLIIGLVASLISYFQKFQPVVDKVNQVLSGLGAAVSVITSRFVKFGEALFTALSGDIVGAAVGVKNAVSGIGDEIIDAATAAYELEAAIQRLRDATLSASAETARQRVEAEKFKAVVDDTSKSYGERIKAAQQAGEIEKKIASEAFDRALEAKRIADAQLALSAGDQVKREAAAKATVEYYEAVSQLNSAQINAQKEIRDLQKEASDARKKQLEDERKKAEELRKEYERLYEDLQRQVASLDVSTEENPVEKVRKQFQSTITETEKLRDKLLKLATNADQKKKAVELVEALFKDINKAYAQELDKAYEEREKLRGGKAREALNPLPPADTIKDDLRFRAKSLLAVLKSDVEENSKSAIEKIQDFIQNNIGTAGKELLVSAFSDITAGLNALNEAQINQQDRIISALDARIQKQQEVVDKEKELAEQGLANNVSIEQDKLDKLQQQREEAEKKRLALEKKAATQQLVIDTAQQISSLTTAAANVFKAESGKGLLGILFALSAIGVLFATFAKAKALASKSATPPKFRKGGKVDGRTHEEGGEAVTDYDGHVFGEVEKGEWIIGTQPSREHDQFLQKLNEGKYRGVPLANIVDRSVFNTPLSGAEPRINRIEQQHREAKDAQQYRAIVEAQERVGERIVRAITEKETVMPWKNGYREKVRKGSTVITKTVLPE